MGTTWPGDGRSERRIGGRTEGAGDGFVESSGEQSAADGGFGFSPRQGLYAFAERGQSVGEAVVAVDACDFFNEVDFAFEIEAPTGECGAPRLAFFGGTLWRSEGAAEAGEGGFDEGRGDAFLVFSLAEDAMDFAEARG